MAIKNANPGTVFKVNGILPIGTAIWQAPCGFPAFSYHEVAWKGNCTSNDPIFDACLAVDGSINPLDNFRLPLLPVNMLLGSRGSGLYRDKLVVPFDWNLSARGIVIFFFTRANIVVLIAKAGRSEVPVSALANQIDRYLCKKPSETESIKTITPVNKAGTSRSSLKKGNRISLAQLDFISNISANDKVGESSENTGRFFFKIFTDTGDMAIENRSLIYRANKNGTPKITVFEIKKSAGFE